ncbi:hypothetical protein UDX32_05430 [Serratia marcescens]|uniref:hypothetical protein n=1 Tax=Serratia marcescens TaxID=615 RepID=UPI001558B9AC|nr:hypothetical protein [Serratia marcescens]CAI2080932.1 Uncharacterised protein [Serratia marcescens]HAT2876971.1 hypothetical protein [Serratia marcescens]HAT2887417.1 hypothetical protein [Serratia marcescens]HAT2893858.1 hypothetical protein [Serratia marcescens]HAT2899650.1 hypothetical protein [Serratia marcescens]
MQEIEAKYFHLIAGAGNFANNRGSNGRVNNNGGNKNNSSSTAIKAAIPAHTQLF